MSSRTVLLLNGTAADPAWHCRQIRPTDYIICVDGGANLARRLGIVPHRIVGDLDSITPDTRTYFESQGCEFDIYPREKDLTDTQIALAIAGERGDREVLLLGALGGRIDHSLANIFSLVPLAEQGVDLILAEPEQNLYITNHRLDLDGQVGELVSIFALTTTVGGVTTSGLQYPLQEAVLRQDQPYAVSNVLTDGQAWVEVGEGVALIIHMRRSADGLE